MKNNPPIDTRDSPPHVEQRKSPAQTTAEKRIPTEENLPLDIIFSLLKNRRRRLVLWYLVTISETSTLSDLAEHIAAVEQDKSEDELTSSERKRVYVCLYQCHLPKMADADIIEFESDRGTVELAENVDQLTPFLDIGETDQSTDWPKYYGGLALLGGALFVAQQFVFPSAIVSGILMGVFVGLFLSLAFENASDRSFLSKLQIGHRKLAITDAN